MEDLKERVNVSGQKLRLYHGSGMLFDDFDQKLSRVPNDYYGGGICYLTSSYEVAKTYAKSSGRKTGALFVYDVDLKPKKIFDVNDVFSGKELLDLISTLKIEEFARNANLLSLNSDKYTVIATLQRGKIIVTGDVLFRALSYGMSRTEFARKILIKNGYDCLRYNGGLNVPDSPPHDVFIPYKANIINIIKHEKL